jgi:hypothetical protein
MRYLLVLVALAILAASAVCFAMGLTWTMNGRFIIKEGDPAFFKDSYVYQCADALQIVGRTLVGGSGVAVVASLALLAAVRHLKRCEETIGRLEEDVKGLRAAVTDLALAQPGHTDDVTRGAFMKGSPGS